jgi:tetratricopeptide (TPR) repeat protein
LYWLSRSYYELRDYDNAIKYGEGAVKLDAGNSDYWYWLGRANGGKAGRESSLSWARKTKSAFEKAVELDAKNIPARRALIEYLTEAPTFLAGGSDSKAREHIEVLISQNPVQGHLAWGRYWQEEKEYDKAEAAYRKVLSLKPRELEPYFEVATYYRRRNDAGHMDEAVEAAAKLDASDVRLNFFRGVARVIAGNHWDEAERFLKTYIERMCARSDDPSPAAAHEWLGRLYERTGKPQQALEHYRTALSLDPGRKSVKEAVKRLQR